MADNPLSGLGSEISGAGQGLENFLSHPAVQGALATYLGAISSPRRLGWGGAIGRGGLAGLGAFSEARRQEQTLPFLQAQTQEAQLNTQRLQQQMRPLSQEEIGQLNQLKQSYGKDPQAAQLIGVLESQLRGGRLTPAEFTAAAAKLDEAKRQAEILKAQASLYGAQMMPQLMQQAFPGIQMPQQGPAAQPEDKSGQSNLPNWSSRATTGPKGTAYLSRSDKKWHLMNPDGTPGPAV